MKFVLVGQAQHSDSERVVVLTDFVFWAEHIDELVDWCREHGGEIQGSVVIFRQESQVAAFILRWS